MLADSELASIQQFAEQLALDAGEQIAKASASRYTGSNTKSDASKKNRVDLVTETDQAVEKLVKARISEAYPAHKFIGEESFAGGERADLTDEPTWIVDPIDGTTNFVHGFDHCCISVGFCDGKVPSIGVVYNPFLNKLYSARRGAGAYLNKTTKLPLSSPNPPLPLSSISDALCAMEWGSDRSRIVLDKKASTFQRLAGDGREIKGGKMAHSLRSIGSAALNYCYVASGQLDLYWEIGCWAWDVCAGVVIAREAGGRCYGRGGKLMDDQDTKDLMGHHFFVVRAVSPEDGESATDAQDRIVREFFEIAEEYDP